MVNDDTTEDTTLKIYKQTKDSKNEPWRYTIKLELKLWDKEDTAYREQLSTGILKITEEIIKRQGKVSTEKRVKLCNVLVRRVLLYNLSTWRLLMNDEKALQSFH